MAVFWHIDAAKRPVNRYNGGDPMRSRMLLSCSAAFLLLVCPFIPPAGGQTAADTTDPTKTLVSRLDLERYKATIRGLTKFGDRRQGTDRNRAAIDWIEAQLKSYGCTNTERIHYDYQPPPPARGAAVAEGRRAGTEAAARAARTLRGDRGPTASITIPNCSPTRGCASSTPSPPLPVRAKRSTAPRSARRIPKRCTSSARTWTASAGARRRTTMVPARRW